jgi:membrane protein implicated in regulation of membrane protease activity
VVVVVGLLVIAELLTGTFYLSCWLWVPLPARFALISAGHQQPDRRRGPAGLRAVLVCYLLRKRSPRRQPASSNRDVNLDVGETVVIEQWNTDGTAQVRYRGATWTVMDAGALPIPARTAWPKSSATACWLTRSIIDQPRLVMLDAGTLRSLFTPTPHKGWRQYGLRSPSRHRHHCRHLHRPLDQGRAPAACLGQGAPGQIRRHAHARPELSDPFVDRVAYKHSLKEIPLDVPSQVCITRDNTQLQVDGILYFQVTDPMRASYGSSNYIMAVTQLAQTSLRSVIGKLELDKTFEERDMINAQVVNAIDEAALNWGVKVLRYEIKDLTPPAEILRAMQAQITAEREKRALIAASEGRRQEQINIATGEREAFIARSEGEKQAAINKAQGEAAAITTVAEATDRRWSAWPRPSASPAASRPCSSRWLKAPWRPTARWQRTPTPPGHSCNMTEVSGLIASAMKMVQVGKSA